MGYESGPDGGSGMRPGVGISPDRQLGGVVCMRTASFRLYALMLVIERRRIWYLGRDVERGGNCRRLFDWAMSMVVSWYR